MTLTITTLCLPLRIFEKIRYGKKIRQTKVREDPIFIIGHWRTGTTYLHYLLAEDKSKGYVSNRMAYLPHFSLAAKKIAKKLLEIGLPEKRPMDNMALGGDLPGEEEFPMALTSKYSFYHVFIFPRKMGYFSKFLTFNKTSPKDIEKWKRNYYNHIQKITYVNKGKQLVLKSPLNTARIKLLKELFPKAKFIYLIRNPYEILASTIHLYQKLLPLFSLQKWKKKKVTTQIIRNFNEMIKEYEKSKEKLTPKELIEIKYEELVKKPAQKIKELYTTLEIDGFQENKKNFINYIEEQRQYRKNKHKLTNNVIKTVNTHWNNYRKKHGYKKKKKKLEVSL